MGLLLFCEEDGEWVSEIRNIWTEEQDKEDGWGNWGPGKGGNRDRDPTGSLLGMFEDGQVRAGKKGVQGAPWVRESLGNQGQRNGASV